MPMPNLLDVQLHSFGKLIGSGSDDEGQWDFGLNRVFGEIFPISDINHNFTLEFISASLGDPKYSVEECIERDMTYAAPLKAMLRLIVWEMPEEEGRGGVGELGARAERRGPGRGAALPYGTACCSGRKPR